jgi:hypothetical protein
MANVLILNNAVCTEYFGSEFGWFDDKTAPYIAPLERNRILPGWFSDDPEERAIVRKAWAKIFQPDLLKNKQFLGG